MGTSTSTGLGFLFIFLVLAIYGIVLLLALAFAIVTLIANWKIFEKAGVEGWKAIIPYYNTFKLAQIAGWLMIGLSVGYLVITFAIQFFMLMTASDDAMYAVIMILFYLSCMVFSLAVAALNGYIRFMLGKSFGKPTVWNVLMIFFSPFLTIAMGFDKNLTYVGPKGEPANNSYYGY